MDGVGVGEGRGQLQGTNPDCPNAANPFHRCAQYCPVPPPPRVVAKSPPLPPPPPGRGKAVQNGTANGGDRAEPVITAAAESEEVGDRIVDLEEVGDRIVDSEDAVERRRRARTPQRSEEAGGREQGSAVNPDCPNAANPFHRCAEYCPMPRSPAKIPPPAPGHAAMNGSTHNDDGELQLQPTPRRRDKGAGSGGLPLYVFLREGSDGEGKKVDPRCPNAPNPFHVCTDHCVAKITDAGRSSEGGGKTPLSIFSRRSSSSSEEGSVKSGGSRKADPKCPNAANPFHECGEYCVAKIQQVEQHKGTSMKSPRTKGGKDIALIQNWKADPRCPNSSNPFHICAQYCFDHLSEAAKTNTTKSDKKKGKAISKEGQRGEINPDCANASNPYHQCGEHCKRKGGR